MTDQGGNRRPHYYIGLIENINFEGERRVNTHSAEKGLTRRQLVKATGCMPFLVDYCRACGYLPILRDSIGPGSPVFFHPDAIKVIKTRMARTSPKSQAVAHEPNSK